MKKMILAAAIIAVSFASCNKKTEGDATANDSISQVDTTQTQQDKPMVDEHTAQTSLDWAGIYAGTLPCADCEGIKTEVALNEDDTFVVKQTYIGKNNTIENNGKIMWHNGNIAHLQGKDVNMQFKVEENQIVLLDQDGKVIEGAMKDLYILKKN